MPMSRALNHPARRGRDLRRRRQERASPRNTSSEINGTVQTKWRVIMYSRLVELKLLYRSLREHLDLAGSQATPRREHEHVERTEPLSSMAAFTDILLGVEIISPMSSFM